MIAKALHLSAVVSVTKSSFGNISHNRTNKTQQKTIHMETFRSGSSGGFAKLDDGRDGDVKEIDGNDQEDVAWSNKDTGHNRGLSDGSIHVVVTRTVEVQSEEVEEGTAKRSGDYIRFSTDVGRAV